MLLLAVTAASGVLLTASAPPTTELARGALERLLGRTVLLRKAEVQLGWTLRVELAGLLVPADDPAEPPLLRVPHAYGRLSWPRLLSGRLLPLDWSFEQPVVNLRAAPGSGAGGRAAAVLPPLDVRVRGGTLTWHPPEGEPVRVERIEVSASRVPLRRGVRGSAVAHVQRGGRSLGAFALEFDGWLSSLDVRGLVQGVDLPSLWGDAAGAPESGVAHGTVDLRLGGVGRVDVQHPLPGVPGPVECAEGGAAGGVAADG